MMSVKQGAIKYHFLSLGYNSTRDGTPVFRAIGMNTRPLNQQVYIYIYIYIEREREIFYSTNCIMAIKRPKVLFMMKIKT